MKIVIIGPASPYRGGIATYNERLATELLNEGHEAELETFTMQYPNFLFPGKSQITGDESPKHLKITRSINSINPLNWFSVGNRIKNEKPDLVIIRFWLPFMGPSFGTILRRIKKNQHTKVVCLVDNMIPHESRIGDKIFTKYFIQPVDAFVAMTKSVIKDIETFDSIKPKILSPHPLFDNFGEKLDRTEALKKLQLPKEYRYLLFFGFIRKYKGLDILIDAFADPRLRKMNIKLIIAGEYYDDETFYTYKIKQHSLQNDIIQINEFIANDDVKYYFNAADVIVQPYKTATQSGVTQIAYHFDKPMIVTDVGGLAEMCPHGKVGYVVAPEVNEIADAIYAFFNNAEQEKYTADIKEEKKKYAWSVLTKNMTKLIAQS